MIIMRVLLVALALPLARLSVGEATDEESLEKRNVTIIIVSVCFTTVFLAIAVVLMCVRARSQRRNQAVRPETKEPGPESPSGDKTSAHSPIERGADDLDNIQHRPDFDDARQQSSSRRSTSRPLRDQPVPPSSSQQEKVADAKGGDTTAPPLGSDTSVRNTSSNEPQSDRPPSPDSRNTPAVSEALQRMEIQQHLERMHQYAVQPNGNSAASPPSPVSSLELKNKGKSPSSNNHTHRRPSVGASGPLQQSSSPNSGDWSIDFDNVSIPPENEGYASASWYV